MSIKIQPDTNSLPLQFLRSASNSAPSASLSQKAGRGHPSAELPAAILLQQNHPDPSLHFHLLHWFIFISWMQSSKKVNLETYCTD